MAPRQHAGLLIPGNSPCPTTPSPDDAQSEKLASKSWPPGKTKLAKSQKAPRSLTSKLIQLWENKVAQKGKMQIEDKVIANKGARSSAIPTSRSRLTGDESSTTRPAIEELIRWRLWNRTGGGLMAELGSHQLDASSIFISAHARRQEAISAKRGRFFRTIDFRATTAIRGRPRLLPVRIRRARLRCQKIPITTARRSACNTPQSTATALAATARRSSAPTARCCLERETDAMLYKTSAVDSKTKVVAKKDKATNKKYPVAIATDDKGRFEISAAVGTLAFGDGHQPRLHRTARALGLVHPQPGPGQ